MRRMLGGALSFCLASTLAVSAADVAPRIAWYGKLSDGLAEAKQSGRPILLVSAAPQCLGVSGI